MRFRRRRFSATPRKPWPWKRGRRTGTGPTRSQYAQFFVDTTLTIEDGATARTPSFLIQALTPWSNAPEGGYDRAWELRGLIWTLQAYGIGHNVTASGPEQNLYATTDIGEVFSRMITCFFVDQADENGAPVSVGGTDLGPFITTPPIASPAAAPADDEFIPTRMLKRHFQCIQTGFTPNVSTGQSAFAIGLANDRWSGAIRKRISIASRQGLYLGWYGVPPVSTFPTGVDQAFIFLTGSVVFYYRLGR